VQIPRRTRGIRLDGRAKPPDMRAPSPTRVQSRGGPCRNSADRSLKKGFSTNRSGRITRQILRSARVKHVIAAQKNGGCSHECVGNHTETGFYPSSGRPRFRQIPAQDRGLALHVLTIAVGGIRESCEHRSRSWAERRRFRRRRSTNAAAGARDLGGGALDCPCRGLDCCRRSAECSRHTGKIAASWPRSVRDRSTRRRALRGKRFAGWRNLSDCLR
jgi:hypothetical protein